MSSDSPWLTLAILAHKPNIHYLNALLASIEAQACCVYVDIVDDSATVKPDELKYRHPLMRFLRHDNNEGGLAGNWNYAVKQSRTDWVTVLHQDDILHDDYTQRIQQLVTYYPSAAAVYCNASIINAAGEPAMTLADWYKQVLLRRFDTDIYALEDEEGSVALLRGNFIFCPAVCFNKQRLGEQGFDPRWKMVPDLDLYLQLLEKGHLLAGSKRVAVGYRRHSQQATASYQADGSRFDEEFALYREWQKRYQVLGWNTAAKVAKRQRIVKLHLLKEFLCRLLTGQLAGAFRLFSYFR